jgi:hypothetical protein
MVAMCAEGCETGKYVIHMMSSVRVSDMSTREVLVVDIQVLFLFNLIEYNILQ